MNFTYVNDWGGTNFSDGMVGMLARQEVDFGGTLMFIIKEYMAKIEYVSLSVRAT